MIEVVLLQHDQAAGNQREVARLRVDDAGSWEMTGDRPFPADLQVRDTRSRRWVGFDDDPETWARYLWTRLRTPYLVPIILTDSTPDPHPDPGEFAAAMRTGKPKDGPRVDRRTTGA